MLTIIKQGWCPPSTASDGGFILLGLSKKERSRRHIGRRDGSRKDPADPLSFPIHPRERAHQLGPISRGVPVECAAVMGGRGTQMDRSSCHRIPWFSRTESQGQEDALRQRYVMLTYNLCLRKLSNDHTFFRRSGCIV